MTPTDRSRFLASLTADEIEYIEKAGGFWLFGGQHPPPGEDWRTWLFLGGRGAGKTRAGAEWVSDNVRNKRFGRIALIAPTFHDVREVIVEGPAGIRICGSPRPDYHATRRQLSWPNGATAQCFSAEDPESLRGPQFDAAWGDELAYWAEPRLMLNTLEHGMRLGERPRLLLTTTPRPIAVIKELVADESVEKTRMMSSAGFCAGLAIAGMRRARRFLWGGGL